MDVFMADVKCKGKMVRIQYWHQITMESGRWILSGLLSRKAAEGIVKNGAFERAEIVPDSDGT